MKLEVSCLPPISINVPYRLVLLTFKVVKWLKKKFDDPKSAQIFYLSSMSVGVQGSLSGAVQKIDVGVQAVKTSADAHTQCNTLSFSNVDVQADYLEECATDLQAISAAFSKYCREELPLQPWSGSKLAIVYNLAKGIGNLSTK